MNRQTIQQILAGLGTRPTRSLGQNFLHDEAAAREIVGMLELTPEDHLVEIGPGLGALTEHAAGACRSMTLIEKDGRLAAWLAREWGDRLRVLHQDALEYDLRELFPHGPTKILGNLPYYISSQVLLHFGSEPTPITRMVFTLQKEMAERLSAKPSTKAYGALTLLVGRRWKVEYRRTLPGSAFLPAPNVESGVVVLIPREPGELPECGARLFTRLVKDGFSQRRKMLRKMLAHHGLDWPALCARLGVPETVRGEALSLEQWIELTRIAEGAADTPEEQRQGQDVHGEVFDVVDERDQVTGQQSRHEVHRRGLRHRAVHLFLFNKRGDLFLQKRSRWKDVHPGRWDSSAAGHLNAGDDYDAAAHRELGEELGVSAPLEAFGTIAACEETGQEFVRCYQGRHDGPFVWPRSEIETGAFFPLAVIERWIAARPEDFAEGFLVCYRLWKEHRAADGVNDPADAGGGAAAAAADPEADDMTGE